MRGVLAIEVAIYRTNSGSSFTSLLAPFDGIRTGIGVGAIGCESVLVDRLI